MANLHIIKEIAKQKNISIRELSQRIGITEQGLQKLIRENSTKVETLENIASALEVSMSIFFNEPETSQPIDFEILKSQQRTIENLSETIKNLTSK